MGTIYAKKKRHFERKVKAKFKERRTKRHHFVERKHKVIKAVKLRKKEKIKVHKQKKKAAIWKFKLKKAVQLRKVFKHKVKRLARKEHHIERRFKHTRCKKGLVKLQKRERSAKHHVHITRVVLVRSNERE